MHPEMERQLAAERVREMRRAGEVARLRLATPHEPRRLIREDGRMFHQVQLAGEWHDVCEFTLEEMPPIDREVANWYTSAHPDSHFKNRLMVARAAVGGRRCTLLNRELKVREPDGHATTHSIETATQLLSSLEEHFGLHFPEGTRFGNAGDVAWPVI